MKKIFWPALLIFILLAALQGIAQPTPGEWSKHKAKKWFKKMEWLDGAHLTPHSSINKKEFARQYHLNKILWDKAFAFLKEHNLDSLPKGRYKIDGDEVTASVTEDPSKDFDKTNWESHHRFIDIQCIISGEEKMGIYPVSKATLIKEYDDNRDAANYSAKGKFYVAGPGVFFIFFPSDAHRPNISPGGNKLVKKIVIKVKVAA
jgi:biofilm protein TabA